MGGVWGLASSTALENIPVEARGLASGVVQQGYAVGYLFAAVINLRLVPSVPQNWRALFWTAAGVSFFAACVRAVTPESEVFLRAQRMEREKGIQRSAKEKTRIFLHETKEMLRIHWMLCIYAVLLMTGMFQVCSTVILTAFPSSANPAFVHQASTSCLMDRKTCTRRTCKLQKDFHQTMPLRPLSSEIAYVQLVLPYPAKKQLT